ncbi:excalibur calcium-binding domain-containing protein [Campylobacter sputorum]|uniref:excalibur calcium-binding domain-containing protein n=1 Tax=Campylobacter sputorum TaxID=206 RepID=UPI00053BFFB9|nr:excalibur calcium-binding domain-containing protein [Campylobacter sputorum]
MKKIFIILLLLSFNLLNAEVDCSVKKYCKQMKSCTEAKEYLQKCGFSNLDRDGDGIPCENVCGKSKKSRK